MVSTVLIQEAFDKNRALASGLSAAGGGVGMILISAIRSATFTAYGWHKGLLVELAFVAICLSAVILVKIQGHNYVAEHKSIEKSPQAELHSLAEGRVSFTLYIFSPGDKV